MKNRNLWLAALWAVGVFLVVGSFASSMWLFTFYSQTVVAPAADPVVEFVQQVLDTLRYPAMLVGFGTLVGLIFLHARNHARKSPASGSLASGSLATNGQASESQADGGQRATS